MRKDNRRSQPCHQPFYDYATNHQIDDYWKDRIEEHLSGLVSPIIGKTMKHYLPTIVEPYETEDGFWYQKSTSSKTPGMISVSRPS